jgi:hypothetical protein
VTAVVPHPTPPQANRARRVAAPAATIGMLSLATVALRYRDPHQSGSWGFCPFHALTGLYCPGCGGLRAVNDLTTGHVAAAFSSNVVVTALIPVATVLLVVWAVDRWRGRTRHVPWQRLRPLVAALVTVLVVFTVARNTGAGAWLAP